MPYAKKTTAVSKSLRPKARPMDKTPRAEKGDAALSRMAKSNKKKQKK